MIRTSTVIIDSHLLVREALDSLIEGHSYRVVCGLNSISEINEVTISGHAPKLVIFGEQSIDDAIAGAVEIRRHWPDAKIVWLFEQATTEDVQRILKSPVDGCVPLCVSPDTLIHALDFILSGEGNIMFVAVPQNLSIQPAIPGEGQASEGKVSNSPSTNGIISFAHMAAPNAAVVTVNGTNGCNGANHIEHGTEVDGAQTRSFQRLSEREAQILDSLVKGHANKVIARTYEITEATVKVHMKSILRKIQVANRTQAAIWALEHGFSADEIKGRLIRAAEDVVV